MVTRLAYVMAVADARPVHTPVQTYEQRGARARAPGAPCAVRSPPSMSVAIACNLSDGVVLAVDSAVTVADPAGAGVAKIYENAQKLFQLGERPIGVAVYGVGTIGSRTIGSYVREFEKADPGGVLDGETSVHEIVEQLRLFFLDRYDTEITPLLEQAFGMPFDQIPPDQVPVLGLVVGGFSHGSSLSEVWQIVLPLHRDVGSAIHSRPPGNFGTNWFAMYDPVWRYVKGYDRNLIDEVVNYFVAQRGQALTDQERGEIQGLLDRFEYQIPYPAMPLQEGISHARFLAELVVSHHRYAVGAPVVGGKVIVGSVDYRADRFQIHSDAS